MCHVRFARWHTVKYQTHICSVVCAAIMGSRTSCDVLWKIDKINIWAVIHCYQMFNPYTYKESIRFHFKQSNSIFYNSNEMNSWIQTQLNFRFRLWTFRLPKNCHNWRYSSFLILERSQWTMPTNICCLATHCVPTIQDVHLTWAFGHEEAVGIMSATFHNTRPETNSNDHLPGVFGQVWTQFNCIFVTLDYCWLNMGSPLNTRDNTSGQTVGGSLLQIKPCSINGKSHSQCFWIFMT